MNKGIITLILTLLPMFSMSAESYNILDFGARAGKDYLNTDKIQAAIDKCSADGGGYVVIPRGEFVSGTLELKSGVMLYLEHGARLQGSSRKEDYTKHLIRALDATDIGIDGHGVIDGSGYSFWYVKENGLYDHDRPVPGYMIYLENCKRVRVTGVRMSNPEAWTLHLLGCSDVTIRDITIRNPLHGPTNDGIDIQACQDVTISGCDIYTSDDAIVLKNRHPKYNMRPCKNITVTGCILTSVCNRFKIGTETIGQFRNIVFSNSTVRFAQPTDSLARIRVSETKRPLRASSGISIESVDGSLIDGVVISNITMEEVKCPIFIRLANRGEGVQKVKPTQPGKIRNVLITNVNVRNAWFASSITAIPGSYVENVTLSNINVTMRKMIDTKLVDKVVDEKVDAYPDANMWANLPATSFFFRHVDDVACNMIRCEVDGEDNRPAMIFDDAQDVIVNGLILDENYIGDSAVRLVNTRCARFSNCDIKDGVKFQFDLRGELNTDIRLSDTDPAKVRSEKSCNVEQSVSFVIK